MTEYTLKDDLRQRDMETFFAVRRTLEAGTLEISAFDLGAQLGEMVQAVRGTGLKPGTPEFLQVFTQFVQELRERRTPGPLSGPEENGVIVRAAIRAGWLTNLEESDVPDLKPAIITDLARRIGAAISAAYELPGE